MLSTLIDVVGQGIRVVLVGWILLRPMVVDVPMAPDPGMAQGRRPAGMASAGDAHGRLVAAPPPLVGAHPRLAALSGGEMSGVHHTMGMPGMPAHHHGRGCDGSCCIACGSACRSLGTITSPLAEATPRPLQIAVGAPAPRLWSAARPVFPHLLPPAIGPPSLS